MLSSPSRVRHSLAALGGLLIAISTLMVVAPGSGAPTSVELVETKHGPSNLGLNSLDQQGRVNHRSGCARQVGGDYEVCLASPPTKGGSDPAVMKRISAIFSEAGAGDTIRIAMFRWDLGGPATALIKAHQRGARVELVVDPDVLTKKAGRRVVAAVRAGGAVRGSVVVCSNACLPWSGRGSPPPKQDVMHLKMFLFDIAGERSVALTSANIERRQNPQYNNLVRVVDAKLYSYHLAYFARLRAQSWSSDGVRWDEPARVSSGLPGAFVFPTRKDRIVRLLNRVRCVRGARRVDIAVAVIQRYDVRALLGRLDRRGCRVRIVVTRELIENWLQAPVRQRNGTTTDLPNRRVRHVLLHDKIVNVHAKLDGRKRHLTLVGTSNWTCGGLLYNDEVMLRVENRWVWQRYQRHFRDLYRNAKQSRSPVMPVQRRCR